MTKYFRLTLEGEPPEDEIQSAVGEATLVRTHTEAGTTRVYFATEEDAHQERVTAAFKEYGDGPVDVDAEEVMKI